MIAHNGEINTLMGNRNWMRARETQLASELLGRRPAEGAAQRPPGRVGLRDLRQRARAAHPVRPLAPPRDDDDDPRGVGGPRRHARRAARLLRLPLLPHGAVGRAGRGRLHRRTRRRRHAGPQRPAPRPLGGDLGRLRRARLRDAASCRCRRRRSCARAACSPATCSSSTSSEGRIVEDAEIKRTCPPSGPTASGTRSRPSTSTTCRAPSRRARAPSRCTAASSPSATARRTCACCSRRWRRPGAEPTGSMGNDLALAVLSDKRPSLFSYFKQLFAQVTNPAIDPIRESIVMSLATGVGAERNLFEETPEHAHQLVMRQPILTNAELEKLRQRARRRVPGPDHRHHLAGDGGRARHGRALQRVCARGVEVRRRARRRRHRPVRPPRRPGARADPLAAGGRGRAPPPRARGHAPARRAGDRVRRAARGAPHGAA